MTYKQSVKPTNIYGKVWLFISRLSINVNSVLNTGCDIDDKGKMDEIDDQIDQINKKPMSSIHDFLLFQLIFKENLTMAILLPLLFTPTSAALQVLCVATLLQTWTKYCVITLRDRDCRLSLKEKLLCCNLFHLPILLLAAIATPFELAGKALWSKIVTAFKGGLASIFTVTFTTHNHNNNNPPAAPAPTAPTAPRDNASLHSLEKNSQSSSASSQNTGPNRAKAS